MLEQILSEADVPCEGCAWQSSCSGYRDQLTLTEELVTSPKGRCLICGGDALERVTESKLILGSFHYCDEVDDEYVFVPLEVSAENSSADAIEF